MRRDIDRVLISEKQIAERVGELAQMIIADHTPPKLDRPPQITIVPILTGGMIFCADLVRQIPIAMQIGIISVSSYPGQTVTSQGAQVVAQQLGSLNGRRVVLLDDVLDSGQTIRLVQSVLQQQGAASVRTCVLLRKDRPTARDVHVDYVGFDIPDVFVVGYGLDFDNYYRNLPDIVTLKAEVLARSANERQA
jgi:hypoxanthine phosphoribosyltransferase